MDSNRTTGGDSGTTRDPLNNNLERHSTIPNDLPDSPEDQKKLEAVEITIDLPDVKDIPGQEFVNAPPLGALADTTISSADEEGEGIFDDEETTDASFDVTAEERNILERTDYMPTTDENNLTRASMDSTDFQGEALNEKGFGQGIGDTVADEDLDMDAAEDDTATDAMGQGDEENKSYSIGGAENDNVVEGTP
jgi:hypothetical protein